MSRVMLRKMSLRQSHRYSLLEVHLQETILVIETRGMVEAFQMMDRQTWRRWRTFLAAATAWIGSIAGGVAEMCFVKSILTSVMGRIEVNSWTN